jgi:hypothetical protein
MNLNLNLQINVKSMHINKLIWVAHVYIVVGKLITEFLHKLTFEWYRQMV